MHSNVFSFTLLKEDIGKIKVTGPLFESGSDFPVLLGTTNDGRIPPLNHFHFSFYFITLPNGCDASLFPAKRHFLRDERTFVMFHCVNERNPR